MIHPASPVLIPRCLATYAGTSSPPIFLLTRLLSFAMMLLKRLSNMSRPEPGILHPHVARDPKVCGGSPIISSTRFPVRSVVHYILQLGLTPEELIEKFPHLSLAQVYDALAYYYDNHEEIDLDIAGNKEEISRSNFEA